MLLKKPDNQSGSSQISVEVKQAIEKKLIHPGISLKTLQQYFPDVSWEVSFGLLFFFFFFSDCGIPVRSGLYVSPAAGLGTLLLVGLPMHTVIPKSMSSYPHPPAPVATRTFSY